MKEQKKVVRLGRSTAKWLLRTGNVWAENERAARKAARYTRCAEMYGHALAPLARDVTRVTANYALRNAL